jgi:hypothetical protein
MRDSPAAPEIRVGVIGAGHLGTYHAGIYAALPGVRLAAVADIVPEKARKLAEPLGAAWADAAEGILAQVEAVSVATPTTTHLEVARACLTRGVHVLVEKPMAATLAEAEEMVQLAEAQGLVLAVGHTERFNPAFRRAMEETGPPRFLEAHRLAPFLPRSLDVDVVLDLMIHDLDLVHALVRSPLAGVEAVGVAVLTPRCDIANARLAFADGTVANLTASRISRERLRKIRWFAANEYVSVDLLARSYQRAWLSEGPAAAAERIQWSSRTVEGNALEAEIRDFLEAVRGRRRPEVSGRQALEVLRLAHRVREVMSPGGVKER